MTHSFFGIFDSIQSMADAYGVTYANALAFSRRHEIPQKHDLRTMEIVQDAGKSATYEQLVQWHNELREWRQRNNDEESPPVAPWLVEEDSELDEVSVAAE